VPAAGVIAIAAWLPDPERLAQIIQPEVARRARTHVVVGKGDESGYDGSLKLVDHLRSLGGIAQIEMHDGGHEYPPAVDAILAHALRSFRPAS
jgi:predicted esterase